ncbi:MAG: ATP-binding cassette domain-containing protein [Bacillota bacterium]|jgi:ABC-type oligopeptide transport system ATPase subunit|nr:ATP-binding cassette domain-containing protein [Bacillota bacterium]NLL25924.1 ATP-binding cassette domain-containing protein [Erysipelotrichia bacterium]
MKNREVLLSVQNLEQFFKMGRKVLKAVNDVSFDIYKGEVFGLVGESGCGKTTTGRTIIRLYDATGGSVYFKGHRIVAGIRQYKAAIKEERKALRADIKKLAGDSAAIDARKAEAKEKIEKLNAEIASARHDHKNCNKIYAQSEMERVNVYYDDLINKADSTEEKVRLEKEKKAELKLAKKERLTNKIQMIFQDPIASLDPRMTVKETIAEGLKIRGIKDKDYIKQEVLKVLDKVGLVPEHATRYPHEFSGGQRQRIGIARAIVLHPELIIADEPISALDVSIQAQVINLLNDLRKDLGLTILFIAHDLSVVKYFSDRIGVMYYGNLVELASSDELFAHPMHPYTRSLLSAIPLPDPHTERNRKRIVYNPLKDHDYENQKPTFREVIPGHFVLCNDEEEARYKREFNL